MKHRYKILTALVISMTLAGLWGHTTHAEPLNFLSTGRFEFKAKQENPLNDVVFDVADLKMLDQKIESLSNQVDSTKAEIINLLKMKNNPNYNVSDTAGFGDIKNYLTQIDMVPEDTFYYESGTQGDENTIKRYRKVEGQYYACDAFGNVAEGTAATDVSGLNILPYTAMVLGNLSAGCAGYASGNFYLGNGADNASSYAQGVVDGMANALDNLQIEYHYHEHTGDPSVVGGCYGEFSKATSVRCSSTYGLAEWTDPESGRPCYAANCYYNHTIAGGSDRSLVQPYVGLPCQTYVQKIVTYIDVKCGKTEQTIESVTITY